MLDGEFIQRPPNQHIVDGRIIHVPPSQGKQEAMQCVYSIVTVVKQTMQLLKQLSEKSVNKYLINENMDLKQFVDFALECPEC